MFIQKVSTDNTNFGMAHYQYNYDYWDHFYGLEATNTIL
jgi:hypothetical protein